MDYLRLGCKVLVPDSPGFGGDDYALAPAPGLLSITLSFNLKWVMAVGSHDLRTHIDQNKNVDPVVRR